MPMVSKLSSFQGFSQDHLNLIRNCRDVVVFFFAWTTYARCLETQLFPFNKSVDLTMWHFLQVCVKAVYVFISCNETQLWMVIRPLIVTLILYCIMKLAIKSCWFWAYKYKAHICFVDKRLLMIRLQRERKKKCFWKK